MTRKTLRSVMVAQASQLVGIPHHIDRGDPLCGGVEKERVRQNVISKTSNAGWPLSSVISRPLHPADLLTAIRTRPTRPLPARGRAAASTFPPPSLIGTTSDARVPTSCSRSPERAASRNCPTSVRRALSREVTSSTHHRASDGLV